MVAANKKLHNQGFILVKLKSSLLKFTVAIMTWWNAMEYLCHKWPRLCFTCRKHFPLLSSFMTYYRLCSLSNTTGATSSAGTSYPSGVPEFNPGFGGVCYFRFLVFCVMFCRLFFVILAIVLSFLLRFTVSGCPFRIFKLFLYKYIH